jgi:hypothetical protein
MSKGGGGNNGYMYVPQTRNEATSSTSSKEIPAWLTQAAQNSIGNAQAIVANNPAYMGRLAPGATEDQLAAGNTIRENMGRFQPTFNNAIGAAEQGLGPTMYNSLAGQMRGGLADYMNPYTNQVIGSIRDQGKQSLQNSLNTLRDGAIKSGAAYGSRHGVQEGAAAAQQALGEESLISQLLNNQYNTAAGYAQSDAQNQLANDQANRSALQQGSANLANVATAGQASNNADINAQLGFGNTMYAQQLAGDQAVYNEFVRQVNQQNTAQQLLNQAVANAPHSETGSTTTNTASIGFSPVRDTSGNTTMQNIGTGIGIAAKLAPYALSFMSDEDLKKDIEHLGRDALSGLPIKAYRWKGEPKNAKKTVGPIAQDVQKVEPQNVKRVGGKLAVNSLAGNRVMPRYAGKSVAQAKKGLLG